MSRGPLRPGDPDRIAGYSLESRLGQGGQGAVFLGRDAGGRAVAVKLLHPELLEDASARRRFVVELAAVRRVARFCTAQVLDADTDGERPYIVSEFVDGASLQEVVSRSGPRQGADLDRLAVATATALVAIHEAGVVHCDFKPANVLLAHDGPRVIDFGIARALDASGTASQIIGTPAYMAPEQISRSEIRPPVDVFAWGATVAFAVNEASPFAADSGPATIYRVLESTPELGRLEGPLRGLVEACLAKDPADRPTSQELLLALVTGSPTTRPASGRATRPAQGPSTQPPTWPATGASTGPQPTVADDDPTARPPRPTRALPAGGRPRRRALLIGAVAAAVVLIAVAVVLVLTLLPGPGATAIPETFAGGWNGRGRLPDEGTDVYPSVTLVAGNRLAEISAGESGCAGGRLIFRAATDDRLEMDCTPAAEGCPGGTMVFDRTGDRQLEMHLGAEETTSYFATLTR